MIVFFSKTIFVIYFCNKLFSSNKRNKPYPNIFTLSTQFKSKWAFPAWRTNWFCRNIHEAKLMCLSRILITVLAAWPGAQSLSRCPNSALGHPWHNYEYVSEKFYLCKNLCMYRNCQWLMLSDRELNSK